LRQADGGITAQSVSRAHNISELTFNRRKNKFGALIEHGFAIYNVTVMDMTPLYMFFLVDCGATGRRKKRESIRPARSPRGLPCQQREPHAPHHGPR